MKTRGGTSARSAIGAGFLALSAAVLMLGLSAGPIRAEEGAGAAGAEKIQELVRNLGHKDFKVREQAQKELTEIGRPARSELEKAAQSSDLEVKQRAEAILVEIPRRELRRNSEAVAKNVLWTFPIKAGAAGSPAVRDGWAFAVSADRRLYAVNLKTGKEAWSFEDFAEGAKLTHPAAGGGMVFVSDRVKLCAVDAQKGKLAWKFQRPDGEEFLKADGPAQPTVVDGVVYIGNGFTWFAALDAKTGLCNWKAALERPQPPFVGIRSAVGDDVVCLAAEKGNILGLDAKTGKQLWAAKRAEAQCSGLVIKNGALYFQSGRSLHGVDVKTGEKLWQFDLPAAGQDAVIAAAGFRIAVNGMVIAGSDMQDEQPLALGDGEVHVISGDRLCAVDANSGRKKWEYKLELKGPGSADGQAVRIGNGGAFVVGGVAGGAGGAVQLRVVAGANGVMTIDGAGLPDRAGLTIGDGVAYIGSPDGLEAVSLKNGDKLWRLRTAGAVSGRAVLADGVLYFGTAEKDDSQPAAGDDARKDVKDALPAGLHALRVRQ